MDGISFLMSFVHPSTGEHVPSRLLGRPRLITSENVHCSSDALFLLNNIPTGFPNAVEQQNWHNNKTLVQITYVTSIQLGHKASIQDLGPCFLIVSALTGE